MILQQSLAGEGIVEWRGRKHVVPEGHAFICIVPEASRYYYSPEAREPWTFSWANFEGAPAVELWRRMRDTFGIVISLPASSPAGVLFAELVRAAENYRQAVDPFSLSINTYAFAMTLWRQIDQPERRSLDRALAEIEQHYRARMSVKELATAAGLSREHLTRVFASRYGMGPAAWLRKRRLEAARRWLVSTDLPLHEIALRCGFFSEQHFSRAFRRVENMTPQAWRRQKNASS